MGLVVEIKVVPSSGQQKWVIDTTGRLKCYLKSPPEDGKANQELIKMLAEALHIARNAIVIKVGATSRNKLVSIATSLTYEQLLASLALEQQTALF